MYVLNTSTHGMLREEEEGRAHGGHVTGSFAGGSREGLQRANTIYVLGVLI